MNSTRQQCFPPSAALPPSSRLRRSLSVLGRGSSKRALDAPQVADPSRGGFGLRGLASAYKLHLLPAAGCLAAFALGAMLTPAAARAQPPVETSSAGSNAGPSGETSSPELASGGATLDLSVVRQTLRQLQARQLHVREAAEQKLLAMGVAVLPHLPEVTPRTAGELRVRLQRVRQTLQQAKVERDFLPSSVSLQGKMRLAEAIEQIVLQTQNPMRIESPEAVADRPLELALHHAPFWEALASVMQQADLRINPFASADSELILSPAASSGFPPSSHSFTGPFRMDMTAIRSTLPFNSSIGGQLELSFTLTWEPRLRPIYMQVPMREVRAELASGVTLGATNPQATPEIPLDLGGCSTQIDLLVERPARSATKISKLSGELSIAVPSQRHAYVFPQFSDGARHSEKFGDVTVALESARRNGLVYEVRLYIDFGDSHGALDSFRGWIATNEAYLLDASGKRLQPAGSSNYAVTPDAVGVAYQFEIDGNAQDYTLVYESPAAITMQTVQYNLHDIELP